MDKEETSHVQRSGTSTVTLLKNLSSVNRMLLATLPSFPAVEVNVLLVGLWFKRHVLSACHNRTKPVTGILHRNIYNASILQHSNNRP